MNNLFIYQIITVYFKDVIFIIKIKCFILDILIICQSIKFRSYYIQ